MNKSVEIFKSKASENYMYVSCSCWVGRAVLCVFGVCVSFWVPWCRCLVLFVSHFVLRFIFVPVLAVAAFWFWAPVSWFGEGFAAVRSSCSP